MDLPVMPPVKPMLAKAAKEVPGGDMIYEPKWDGFRCLMFRDGDEVQLTSRNTKALTRYFPELLGPLIDQVPARCVLDCELVVPADEGLDFDLLSQRIHPAQSRVKMLSESTPAHLIVFDILALDDLDLRPLPFSERRATIEQLLEEVTPPLHLTPATEDLDVASEWFARFDGGGFDGVMAKSRSGTYESDKRAQVKVKHHRTVDCVVAGYAEHKNGGVGSLKLGLYDHHDRLGDAMGVPAPADGSTRLHHVGVASAFSAARRRTLAGELAPYADGAEVNHPWGPPPGSEPIDAVGTGSDTAGDAPAGGVEEGTRVPAMPNRWSGGKNAATWVPLRPELVVEVTCENVSGWRFRHPARFVRWRPDKDPADCSMDQLATPVPEEFDEIFGG